VELPKWPVACEEHKLQFGLSAKSIHYYDYDNMISWTSLFATSFCHRLFSHAAEGKANPNQEFRPSGGD